ncbi:hypothetical protein HD806DRAFT_151702 [Xylariaceae sp. AK1471]|nr:hypothetical protein HD806DRAFT_151702 [Xylariaceae sp. AK1471]
MTNLGPLPTDFTVAADCASEIDDVYKVFTVSPDWYYLLQGPVEQTSCYPSDYTANSQQFYSPARCPTGFTAACSSLNSAGTVKETVVTCCPTQANFGCGKEITYVWEKTLGCRNIVDSATMVTWIVSKVSDGKTSLTTSIGNIGGVNAYSLQVRYQSTDFVSTTSTTSSTTSSISSQTPPAVHATSTSTTDKINHNDSSSADRKGGLSPGAAAGVAIGAFAGVLILVALIWLHIRHRRRQKQQYYDPPKPAPPKVVHEMGTYENVRYECQ